MPQTHTIYVLTRGKRNADGDLVGPATEKKPIYGVNLWPRAGEVRDGGEVNIDGWNAKLPWNGLTQSISGADHVEIFGKTYAVDGPTAPYPGKAVIIKTTRVATS